MLWGGGILLWVGMSHLLSTHQHPDKTDRQRRKATMSKTCLVYPHGSVSSFTAVPPELKQPKPRYIHVISSHPLRTLSPMAPSAVGDCGPPVRRERSTRRVHEIVQLLQHTRTLELGFDAGKVAQSRQRGRSDSDPKTSPEKSESNPRAI